MLEGPRTGIRQWDACAGSALVSRRNANTAVLRAQLPHPHQNRQTEPVHCPAHAGINLGGAC